MASSPPVATSRSARSSEPRSSASRRRAHRIGLHHDAQVPPQHVPGRRCHARPRAPQEVHGQTRARRALLLLHRRRAAPDHGAARLSYSERDGRPLRLHRSTHTGLHPKARKIYCSEILYRPKEAATGPSYCVEAQDHKLDKVLDLRLIAESKQAVENGTPVVIETAIRNSDRATGAMLSAPSPANTGARACRRHHPHSRQGQRRTELRRVRVGGHDTRARGRCQRPMSARASRAAPSP